jgi:hypothetical protein
MRSRGPLVLNVLRSMVAALSGSYDTIHRLSDERSISRRNDFNG